MYDIQANAQTYTMMLSGFGRLGSEEAVRLIRAIASIDTQLPAEFGTRFYTVLIESYARIGYASLAFQTWEVMKYRGIPPDNITASVLIDIWWDGAKA